LTTHVEGVDGLEALVGVALGPGDWHLVTQEQVDRFANATGDHQWIHVDAARARAGPFGGPIAHGYLTLALAPMLLPQVLSVTGVGMGVNYGLNRVRFPAPVPVGSRLRLSARVAAVDPVAGGAQVTVDLTFEIEGHDKPACTAQAVYRYYRSEIGS
jgi:acyl dehydratase